MNFNFTDISAFSRKGSVKSKDAKRWGSHENLLNHSNQTKGELRDLVTYQENYIQQLEEELAFCRSQLADTIDKVRHATLMKEKESKDVIEKLRSENDALKKQTESKHETLKRDNVWLVNAVQSLKEETMELQRRETDAVEQVRQSVHMAEQISMEKVQVEMELDQVKQQLERQQKRIKDMVEEHLDKIDQVRGATEKRCRDEFAAMSDQAEQHASQVAHLAAELERSQRKELDLRKQMSELKILGDKVQEEYDTRIGQLQMEMVHVRTLKQQLEHEISCLRVDYDHTKSDLESMEARQRNEVESYKNRLKRIEQLLEESRSECLNLTDAKSQLEREVNLLRMTSSKPTSSLHGVADSGSGDNHLRSVLQKQRHIIDELRTQCTDLASKLQSVSSSYSDQVAKLSHQLGESVSQIQVLDGQAKQYGAMYEQCCRRIQDLEREKAQLQDELDTLFRGRSVPKSRPMHIQNEAIVVEQNGQITSPLSKHTRN